MIRSFLVGAFAYRRRNALKRLVVAIVIFLVAYLFLSELVDAMSGLFLVLGIIVKWGLVLVGLSHLYGLAKQAFASPSAKLEPEVGEQGTSQEVKPNAQRANKTRSDSIYEKYRK